MRERTRVAIGRNRMVQEANPVLQICNLGSRSFIHRVSRVQFNFYSQQSCHVQRSTRSIWSKMSRCTNFNELSMIQSNCNECLQRSVQRIRSPHFKSKCSVKFTIHRIEDRIDLDRTCRILFCNRSIPVCTHRYPVLKLCNQVHFRLETRSRPFVRSVIHF